MKPEMLQTIKEYQPALAANDPITKAWDATQNKVIQLCLMPYTN